MTIKSYQDLRVWQLSFKLGVEVYNALKESKHYSLKDQIQRSAITVPSNIAEGFERTSNKEYIYFLKVSRASCAELRTQLLFAGEVGALELESSDAFAKKSQFVSAMLQKLINARKKFKTRDR